MPPVLIMGPIQYRRQIAAHFEDLGYTVDTRRDKDEELAREDGLRILAEDNEANLGWRIILEHEPTPLASHCIRAAGVQPLVNFIPDTLKAAVRRDVDEWKTRPPEERGADAPSGNGKPIIKLTSFEGAKGLSGAHVFIVGLEDGSCLRDGTNVKDIEVCQFVVGLTRTRKCCALMYTERFAGPVPCVLL